MSIITISPHLIDFHTDEQQPAPSGRTQENGLLRQGCKLHRLHAATLISPDSAPKQLLLPGPRRCAWLRKSERKHSLQAPSASFTSDSTLKHKNHTSKVIEIASKFAWIAHINNPYYLTISSHNRNQCSEQAEGWEKAKKPPALWRAVGQMGAPLTKLWEIMLH